MSNPRLLTSFRINLPGYTGILVLTAIALAVRLYTACWTGLATDEANGIILAITGSWPDVIQHLKEDGNAPLLSLLIRMVNAVFGHSDIAMKVFAILLATAEVPICFVICRRFLPGGLCLQVAAMIALSSTLVRYSTMIRPYALISIFSLVSSWLCMEVLRRKSFAWAVAYGISNALLVYSHYWGGFVCLGQAGLVLIGMWRKWFDRKAVAVWLSGAALSALLFLPWVPILSYQLHNDLAPWLDQPYTPADLLIAFASHIFVGPVYTASPVDQGLDFLSFLFLMTVLIVPASLKDLNFDGRQWKALALIGYGLGLLVACCLNVLRQRYLTIFTPLFALIYVTSASMLLPRRCGLLVRVLPVLVWLPLWLTMYVHDAHNPETSSPAIVDQVIKYADRKKDLVLITTPTIAPAVTFYLPDDLNVITLPELYRRNFNRWDTMFQRMRNPELLTQLFYRMKNTLANGGKIWLIFRGHEIHTANFMDESRSTLMPYLAFEAYRTDQIRSWLLLNSVQIGKNRLAPGRDFDVVLSEFVAQE